MREFFRSLSLNTIGIVAIVACLVVIVASDPPKSLCDAEIGNFKRGMLGLLYSKSNQKPTLPQDKEICLARRLPGACVSLFNGLRKFLDVSSAVSEQCQGKLSELEEYQTVLIKSLDLMTELAWGSAPPESAMLKTGWLNPSDVFLYCRLRNRVTQVYGDKRWEGYREKYFTQLPGAKDLNRQQVWEKSLLSTNCNSL